MVAIDQTNQTKDDIIQDNNILSSSNFESKGDGYNDENQNDKFDELKKELNDKFDELNDKFDELKRDFDFSTRNIQEMLNHLKSKFNEWKIQKSQFFKGIK